MNFFNEFFNKYTSFYMIIKNIFYEKGKYRKAY